MAPLRTRLHQRYVIEGDELAREAEECIAALVKVLAALLEQPASRKHQAAAKRLIDRLGAP